MHDTPVSGLLVRLAGRIIAPTGMTGIVACEAQQTGTPFCIPTEMGA